MRNSRELPEVVKLLGEEEATRISAAGHMPSYVTMRLAQILHQAVDSGKMDKLAFLQVDKERASLMDHIGGCERISKTPLPRVYAIKIRRYIFLFLVTLPFTLLNKVGWVTPFVTMFVAYPTLALDQMGIELPSPFSPRKLGHLPLDEITQTIEKNVLELVRLNTEAR